MTVLQKAFSHREGAKDAKIFKEEVKYLKSSVKNLNFLCLLLFFLRALRVFAVKGLFFSGLTDGTDLFG